MGGLFQLKFRTHGVFLTLIPADVWLFQNFDHNGRNLKGTCIFKLTKFIHMVQKCCDIYAKEFRILEYTVMQMGSFFTVPRASKYIALELI